jgi:hypothetical protein
MAVIAPVQEILAREMRSRIWMLATILGVLALLSPRQITSAQFNASIEGVVRDHEGGTPMSGVRVYFTNAATWGRAPSFVTTDAQGQFAIEVRAAGRYRLLPERPGYVFSPPARLKTPRPYMSVHVPEQGPVPKVELPMAREGIIVGQILDSVSGQPVPSVVVHPAVNMYGNSGNIFADLHPRPEGLPNTEIRTNDRGEYRIFGLQQGEYYVLYNRYTPGRAAPIVGPLFGYYPGVDQLASAVLLQVEAGKETRATPILMDPPSKSVQVRFRYGGTNLKLAAGASPSIIFTSDGWDTAVTVERENDETSVRMGRGHYDVTFQILSATGELLYSVMSFDVGTENLEKEVTLTRGVNVTGLVTLRDANGKTSDASGIRCFLDGPVQVFERIGRSGCIEVQFSTGNYQLRLVNLPADAFVVSAKSGQRDVLRDGIEVARDVHLDIEAATPGAVISGVVTDDKNNRISDATVVLVPDDPYRNAIVLHRSDVSASDGSFEMRGVAPGTYHVFAWADLPGPAYRNSEFLKKYEAQGTPLKVENATPASLNLIVLE